MKSANNLLRGSEAPCPRGTWELYGPVPPTPWLVTDDGSILPCSLCPMAPWWIRLKLGFSSNHIPARFSLRRFPHLSYLLVSPESEIPHLRIQS